MLKRLLIGLSSSPIASLVILIGGDDTGLNDNRCIGIGQHYEVGFLPYVDIFLTSDAWTTFNQKKYSPQSEAMNVTAIAKVKMVK